MAREGQLGGGSPPDFSPEEGGSAEPGRKSPRVGEPPQTKSPERATEDRSNDRRCRPLGITTGVGKSVPGLTPQAPRYRPPGGRFLQEVVGTYELEQVLGIAGAVIFPNALASGALSLGKHAPHLQGCRKQPYVYGRFRGRPKGS